MDVIPPEITEVIVKFADRHSLTSIRSISKMFREFVNRNFRFNIQIAEPRDVMSCLNVKPDECTVQSWTRQLSETEFAALSDYFCVRKLCLIGPVNTENIKLIFMAAATTVNELTTSGAFLGSVSLVEPVFEMHTGFANLKMINISIGITDTPADELLALANSAGLLNMRMQLLRACNIQLRLRNQTSATIDELTQRIVGFLGRNIGLTCFSLIMNTNDTNRDQNAAILTREHRSQLIGSQLEKVKINVCSPDIKFWAAVLCIIPRLYEVTLGVLDIAYSSRMLYVQDLRFFRQVESLLQKNAETLTLISVQGFVTYRSVDMRIFSRMNNLRSLVLGKNNFCLPDPDNVINLLGLPEGLAFLDLKNLMVSRKDLKLLGERIPHLKNMDHFLVFE